MTVCDEEGVDHPTIVTESGMRWSPSRASSSSTSTRGQSPRPLPGADLARPAPAEKPDAEVPRPIVDLWEAYSIVSERRLLECYHDALQARDEALSLFSISYMSLNDRSLAERLFWATCAKIRDKCREMTMPEELQDLESSVSDAYFCNLSIFQSLPDIWAINQLFPILPIHRLDEKPVRKGTLADLALGRRRD